MTRTSARVAVYQLSSKFINRREDVPESARQVVYYALAVGHHVGVMDCFSSLVEIPLPEFDDWVNGLPDGPAKTKLEGVMKWGEIEVNNSHVSIILPAVAGCQHEYAWIATLKNSLQAMVQEPAYYLMVKKLA